MEREEDSVREDDVSYEVGGGPSIRRKGEQQLLHVDSQQVSRQRVWARAQDFVIRHDVQADRVDGDDTEGNEGDNDVEDLD